MKNLDKTSVIGICLCVAAMGGWFFFSTQKAKLDAERMEKERAEQAAIEAANPKPAESTDTATVAADSDTPAPIVAAEAEETEILENEHLRLHFTNKGGGIQYVELLKHKAELDSENEFVQLNHTIDRPIGALSNAENQVDSTIWTKTASTANSITYAADTPDKLRIEKTFTLPEGETDPREVRLDVSIQNNSGVQFQLPQRFVYAGSVAPLHLKEWSMQIGFFWHEFEGYYKAKTVDFFGRKKKILGIFGKNEIDSDNFTVNDFAWAGTHNQFYTSIIEPVEHYDASFWTAKHSVVVEDNPEKSESANMRAAEVAVSLPSLAMAAGNKETVSYELYLGPKEYSVIKDLGDASARVMNYDRIPIFGPLFGWAIKPLAAGLIQGLLWIKGFVPNYGIAIIIITILIRLIIWPIYAKSARSMKRMSKLSPKMKEIQEKYKEDPQEMNKRTWALYKEYGVSPVGGCLPMFIQLPVFLAFYRMLWSAVELRHESFLWIPDLAMPEELFMI
ncbi:MAG: membrane protein insertase YidC, partial [Verrucomicrobiota bacterium]